MPRQRRRARKPNDTIVVPDALVSDMRVALALLRGDEGRRYFQVTLQIWEELGRRLQAKRWADVPDQTIVAIAFGANPEVNEAVMAFLPSHQPSDLFLEMNQANAERRQELHGLTVVAYLARAAKRHDLTLERLTQDMGSICTWLFCHAELAKRLERHPVAASLVALTGGARWSAARRLPYERFLHEAGKSWVSIATRRTAIPREWAQTRLKAKNWKDLERNIQAIGWDRLGKEVMRLAEQPFDQVTLDTVHGKLDFHKAAVKQAVIDEARQQLRFDKRHVLTNDVDEAPEQDRHRVRFDEAIGPRRGAKTSTEVPRRREIELPEDPDRVAAAVARAYRLPPAQRRVVRWITTNPGKHTQPEIARGAKVSLSTVEQTIHRLAEDPSKLCTILFCY